jgi:DNA-binding transcriptional LysR family regulator
MLNVGRLRVLREVAQRGSFSAAAQELAYTQSAVSQQIAALEAETGMALTGAGRTLVEHAEGILARLEAAEEELAALAGLRGGQLRMASFPTAGATLMPVAIAAFRASYPEVELTLAEGEPEEIAPRLQAGEFDLALLFEFGEAREDLRRVELLEDPLYLALPCGHPLADKRALRLGELRGEAWVQTSRSSPCARHVVRCCHEAGFEPQVSFESDDYQTVQGLVAAGVGVALIPELAFFDRPPATRQDIVVRALSPHPPVRSVIAALPGRVGANTRMIPAASAMLRILEEAAVARHRPLASANPQLPQAERRKPPKAARAAASGEGLKAR